MNGTQAASIRIAKKADEWNKISRKVIKMKSSTSHLSLIFLILVSACGKEDPYKEQTPVVERFLSDPKSFIPGWFCKGELPTGIKSSGLNGYNAWILAEKRIDGFGYDVYLAAIEPPGTKCRYAVIVSGKFHILRQRAEYAHFDDANDPINAEIIEIVKECEIEQPSMTTEECKWKAVESVNNEGVVVSANKLIVNPSAKAGLYIFSGSKVLLR